MVWLHVYDLVDNSWLHWAGCGIYHSGIEVYGVEWAYGGHEYEAPGVFATRPREAPGAIAWRERLPMGQTSLTPSQVHDLIQDMGREYKGNQYHLLQMNCNTFSGDLCFRLTGRQPPFWINRVAGIAQSLHCLFPQGWVPPLRPPTIVPTGDKEALLHSHSGPSDVGESQAKIFVHPPLLNNRSTTAGATRPVC